MNSTISFSVETQSRLKCELSFWCHSYSNVDLISTAEGIKVDFFMVLLNLFGVEILSLSLLPLKN